MAKAVITSCDSCGEPGDDVRTYTVRTDGHAWEIDLDDKHAEALLRIARRGRPVTVLGAGRSGTRQLERRIRAVPS